MRRGRGDGGRRGGGGEGKRREGEEGGSSRSKHMCMVSLVPEYMVCNFLELATVCRKIHDCVCNLKTIIISRRCVVFKCCYL